MAVVGIKSDYFTPIWMKVVASSMKFTSGRRVFHSAMKVKA